MHADYSLEIWRENLGIITEQYPHLFRALEQLLGQINGFQGQLQVDEQGIIVNIQYGRENIYADSCAKQLEKLWMPSHNQPITLKIEEYLSDSGDIGTYNSLQRLAGSVYNEFIAPQLLKPLDLDETEGGILLVLGLGLGDHIPLLLDHYQHFNLAIIEENIENIYHALHRWRLAEWIKVIESRGGRLFIWHEPNALKAGYRLHHNLAYQTEGFVHHARLITHLESPFYQNVKEQFMRNVGNAFGNNGFIEDELKMLNHYYHNISQNQDGQKSRLLIDGKAGSGQIPFIIIANGPSLDQSAPFIRAIQGRAIIMTAGTALESAIKLGIIPDFHAELENTAEICTAHQRPIIAPHIGKIRLIAPLSIDPAVPPRFLETLFYARDSLSPSRLLFQGFILDNTSPNCANLAVRAAVALGADAVFLCGVDFGKRVGAKEHSSFSIYEDMSTDMAQNYQNLKRFSQSLSQTANFGGTVESHHIFLTAQFYMNVIMYNAIDHSSDNQGIVHLCSADFYNCSDGVIFDYARPLLPNHLGQYCQGPSITQQIAGIIAPYMPLKHYATHYQQSYQTIKSQCPALKSAIEGLSHQGQTLTPIELYQRINRLLAGLSTAPEGQCLKSMVGGSLYFASFIYQSCYNRLDSMNQAKLFDYIDQNLKFIALNLENALEYVS